MFWKETWSCSKNLHAYKPLLAIMSPELHSLWNTSESLQNIVELNLSIKHMHCYSLMCKIWPCFVFMIDFYPLAANCQLFNTTVEQTAWQALVPRQGHPTTVFCKISVRRNKFWLEFSSTWGWLKISRRPLQSCTIFVAQLTNFLIFTFHSPG